MTRFLPGTSRRHFILGSTLAAAFATMPGGASRAQAPKRGGTLTYLIDEPPTLVSILHTGSPQFVSAKVTEGLLSYDFNLNPQPQLALEWSVSADGLEYRFKLRPNVKWHDGKPFTAEDVAFSINLAKARHPRGSSTYANVVSIATPSADTVVISLSKPSPYMISAFAATETPIVAKHIYDGKDPATNPNNNAPVGTGPFVFKEWVRGSHILYERNPDYWDQPKPHIDRLLVRFIPDAAARSLALETGEVQLAPTGNLALGELDRLKKLPQLAFEPNGQQYDNSITEMMFNLERPHFRDLRVRQAFAHAIDRKFVLDTCWYGYGVLGAGPLSPRYTKYYTPDLPSYDFDPARAERLLDEAGYPRKDGGVRLSVSHDYMPGTEGFRRAADYFKQALAKIGVQVTIRAQDFASYTRRIYTARDFDFTYGYISTTFDPTVGVQRLFWSKNFRPGVPFSNGSAYSNAEVDALLEAAAVEVDAKKRFELFAKFQQIIARDIPALQILTTVIPTISSKRIHNHTVVAEGLRGNFADVYFAS